ncbi:hypothetical protein ACJZ2D_013306 [Fusarium nematophilum]
MYTYPDSAVVLFNCGAKVFFQFITGDLPIQWVPFIDSPIYANDAAGAPMNSLVNYPLCPHQNLFTQLVSFWCLGQKKTALTPGWLVVQADINRASMSQPVVKWAREIRLNQWPSPYRPVDGLRMPAFTDPNPLPDGLPATRPNEFLMPGQPNPANPYPPRLQGNGFDPSQVCETSTSPSLAHLPPTPANSTVEFSEHPSKSALSSDGSVQVVQISSTMDTRNRVDKNQSSSKKGSRKRLSTSKAKAPKGDKLPAKTSKTLLPQPSAEQEEEEKGEEKKEEENCCGSNVDG